MSATPAPTGFAACHGNPTTAEVVDLLAQLGPDAPPELRTSLRRLVVLTEAHNALGVRVAALEAQSEAVKAWVEKARAAVEHLPRPFRSMIPELPEL